MFYFPYLQHPSIFTIDYHNGCGVKFRKFRTTLNLKERMRFKSVKYQALKSRPGVVLWCGVSVPIRVSGGNQGHFVESCSD